MIRFTKIIFLLLVSIVLFNCASGYIPINPDDINYRSTFEDSSGIVLHYKYELLDKKYKKKEIKKGVKLVAVKISNYSDKNLKFGKDFVLTYDDGTVLELMENETIFKSLKQSPAFYLLYLLLTPLKIFTTEFTNGFTKKRNSIPIGLVIGPSLTGSNMLASGSANKKFKKDLLDYNINGAIIKEGETMSGLIGIKSHKYDDLTIKMIQ